MLAALKNADSLLKDILIAVDTSGDGHIQYNGGHPSTSEFSTPLDLRLILVLFL